MPDREISRAGLDVRLADGRTDLLDSIDQPPLARIRDRAAARRRRRRAAGSGGAALLCVAVAATLLLQPWTADGTAPSPPPVADAPPGGPVYTAAGITINGLTGSAVTGIPGTISDVEFVDPDHGYLLAGCPAGAPCPVSLARTGDGGLTWQYSELPWAAVGAELTGFPDGNLMITSGADTYVSLDQGRNWQPVGAGSGAGRVPATAGDLLRAGPGGRCGLAVEVWRPALPRAGAAATDPDLDVCWVAPAATADGAWWVGGTRDGNAAVAVTRDRGTHWRTVELPGTGVPAGPVEVTSLGSQAYATVLDADRRVLALFHSGDGGQSFSRTRSGGPAAPQGLSGEPVPLLDGRLLVAGTDRYFYVSADRGATFSRAEGSLPVVGRLTRTGAGYVAYDLFGSGWAAYSADGATWRKLQIN
ncbi:exo-alpha-sialidase [Plantactinospora sp. S1510]|uniref:Exo-alpha-sialidase n=1 Tax=Plantactinospora alkalitolerans TaxID=2789879 RepID=A0ABS0H841_9ACTN|nr:sialidase family protein [Plantactinospora alkalitolerans]MBF9134635.1 exo-alpha-sialidase [Plantactinospora alkalitolerans]